MLPPAQARPSASASRFSPPGHGAALGPERAQQVPRPPADVTEADESDPRAPHRPALRDRVVVHRGGPHVATEGAIVPEESAAQHQCRRHDVLGDRVLVVEGVGHQGVREERVERHVVGARAGDVQQAQLRRRGRHRGGEPAADIDVGVGEVGDDGRLVECPMPRHRRTGRQPRLEQFAMRQQIPVADDDLHQVRTNAGRLLSNVQPGTRNCMPIESSRAPSPFCRYSSWAASTRSMSSSTPRPGVDGTVR